MRREKNTKSITVYNISKKIKHFFQKKTEIKKEKRLPIFLAFLLGLKPVKCPTYS